MKKFATFFVCLLILVCTLACSREVYVNARTAEAFSSSASSFYVLETNTGKVLAENNAAEQRKNASTTKVLTCITAIENFDDINQIVTVPNAAVGIEGSSIYLKKNQQIKFIDLLYGLMLRSGNDAATAIAHLVSGSEKEFANLMNETAKKAGAQNSNFVNPHGLDHADHFTTAEDLAKITAYALKNETFKQITKTSMHKTSATETTEPQFFYNKNKILHMVDGAIGVKTGYTKKAGRCLVSAAERDGMQVVCVVLNCGPMFEESAKMLNEAFNKYELFSPEFENMRISVNNEVIESVLCKVDGNFSTLLNKGESESVEFKTTLNEVVGETIVGTTVGKIDVILNGETLTTLNLKAIEETKVKVPEETDFLDIVKDLVN